MDIRIIIAVVVIVAIVGLSIQSRQQQKAKLIKRLKKNWGRKPSKQFSLDEFENISHYFKNSSQENVIDDITWNDLNMNEIFKLINNTNSSVGQEYLYKMLRNPDTDKTKRDETERLSGFFDKHEKERTNVQKIFCELGFARRISVSDYVELIVDLKAGSNLMHYAAFLFVVVSVLYCIFVNPVVGIWLIIASIAFSVTTYYRSKARVEHYFICVNQIIRMVTAADEIQKLSIEQLNSYNDKFIKLVKSFSKMTRNSWLLETGTIDGSLAEIILDYLRMLTHVDLIKFNNIVKSLDNQSEEVYELMDTLGHIEASIAIASFRKMLPYWSVPELSENTYGKCYYNVEDVYHPLIAKPVPNSIHARKHILLTGSNASGKSTFLKTIAINAILAQTINTSVSKSYKGPVFRIYSSMALNDDLGNSDSYYIVEIKSLKRILDSIGKNKRPVICFIDEVLRGTNTVERIAASSEILKSLSSEKAMCFAATHDVELTSILERTYENYHFQEDVAEHDVKFNFKLFSGPATTRNAIKLLDMIGYEPSIIRGAEKQASYFLENGVWQY